MKSDIILRRFCKNPYVTCNFHLRVLWQSKCKLKSGSKAQFRSLHAAQYINLTNCLNLINFLVSCQPIFNNRKCGSRYYNIFVIPTCRNEKRLRFI